MCFANLWEGFGDDLQRHTSLFAEEESLGGVGEVHYLSSGQAGTLRGFPRQTQDEGACNIDGVIVGSRHFHGYWEILFE